MELTSSQLHWRDLARKFAQEVVRPVAVEMEASSTFPREIMRKMGEAGLLGIPYPKEYGGSGGDTISYVLAVEEISRVWGSLGLMMAAHVSLGCNPIYIAGSEEQKRTLLPPLLRGEKLGAFGLTEPQAGSDAGGTKTTAVLKDDFYIVNGSKNFTTTGSNADVLIIAAVTDKGKGKKGISAFFVEKGTPGFSAGRKEDKVGLRASDTVSLIFDSCALPRENLLGREGEGFRDVFLTTLDGGRISIASWSVGIAQGAFETCAKHLLKEMKQEDFMGEGQLAGSALAEMATKIAAARLMTFEAARRKEMGLRYIKEGAMAKYFASMVCTEVTSRAISLVGLEALTRELSLEQSFRDAKLTEIGEGTSEIQKIVIARELYREFQGLEVESLHSTSKQAQQAGQGETTKPQEITTHTARRAGRA